MNLLQFPNSKNNSFRGNTVRRLKIEDFFKYLVYSDLPLEASSGST